MSALKNSRHEAFARIYAGGTEKHLAARTAGFHEKSAKHMASRLLAREDILRRIQEIQEELKTIVLVDAARLHRDLSEMFAADIIDILDDKNNYKPLREWPPIWRRMLSRLDIKRLFERSTDGGGARWDQVGEIVKIRYIAVEKLAELLGRHKDVDAWVATKIEAKLDMNLKVEDITARLHAGRARLASEQ